MTHDSFANFKRYASSLLRDEGVDYQTASIDMMANEYCDACDSGDERKKDLYISGLMLRFWYTVGKMKAKSPVVELDDEEFVSWLFEAISYACKYRAWRNKSKHVNAQQAINRCIETIRLQHYYNYNLAKNKANYNAVSLDQPMGAGYAHPAIDYLADEDASAKPSPESEAVSLIKPFVDKDKLVEAIVLDKIAFGDVLATGKEGNSLSRPKLFKELRKLDGGYALRMCQVYGAKPQKVEAVMQVLSKATSRKLGKYLDSAVSCLKASYSKGSRPYLIQ